MSATSFTLTGGQSRPRVLADVLATSRARDVALTVAGAAFVGLLAQISVHIPGTPVPITGQTLGVLLTGTALGWRRGGAALALYAVAGLLGVPWYASGASGYVGASFGYVVGFVLCALACGAIAQRGGDRRLLTSIPSMLVGEVVMYVVGVTWLAVDLHVGVGPALSMGLTPFLLGDALKAALAAVILPGVWKLLGSRG